MFQLNRLVNRGYVSTNMARDKTGVYAKRLACSSSRVSLKAYRFPSYELEGSRKPLVFPSGDYARSFVTSFASAHGSLRSMVLGLGLLSRSRFGWCETADCGCVKLNDFSCATTVRLFLAGDLGAGDVNRPALADLSGAVCLMDLIGNLAEDDHPVPGGFTLCIVHGEREPRDRLVALAVVPGVPTEPALQLDLRDFAALLFLSRGSPCVMTCCAVI